MSEWATGYFGISGSGKATKVHFVVNGHPICRAPLRSDQEFQWCASGWKFHYVECDRCRNIANKEQQSPYD